MKICIIFGEREVIDTDTRTWTTSHFTWGEGNQETDHVLTITHYRTNIKIYVDNPKAYSAMKGLTANVDIHEIPSPSSSVGLSKLTGLCIKSNLLLNYYPNLYYSPQPVRKKLIPNLDGELYAYIENNNVGNEEQLSFYYRKIELTKFSGEMTLVREINAYTQEQKEETYR